MGTSVVLVIELGRSVVIGTGLGLAAGLACGIAGIVAACREPGRKKWQECMACPLLRERAPQILKEMEGGER